jgi:pimeloyl-ACP methyl ester carboxylesterase
VTALKGSHRVIRFDLPGFGLTGPFTGGPDSPYPADDYHDDTLARFTLDLIDSLRVQRFSIVGNSLGGEVAWRVALKAPERAQSLVLVDSAGYEFTPKRVPIGFLVARLPVLGALAEYFLPRSAVAMSLQGVYGHPERVSQAQIDRYFELTLRDGNRHAFRLRVKQLELGKGAALIPQLRLPTLVMWGGQDRLIPPANAAAFLRDIPGSRLVQFDDLGHIPQEEDPARSAEAAQAFFLSLRAPG